VLASVAASVGALAALAVLFGLVLEPAQSPSCTNEPLPGAYRDALAPAHLVAAAVIAGGLWLLRPRRRTLWGLGAVGAFAAVSLAWADAFGIFAFLGIVFGPTVLLALAILLAIQTGLAIRRRQPGDDLWQRHATSAELLGWTALVAGIPAAYGFSWIHAASLFCF
jgi:hypothetical protein